MSLIYQPEEDSYLMQETLEKYLTNLIHIKKTFFILDMGTGSGIQAKACIKLGFKNILASDINKEAIKELKKQKIKSTYSNLFSKISKKQKFNLIIFNPPYLPENKLEDKESKLATTAGKQGYEIIIKFLRSAKSHLNKDGKIIMLFSSLSHPKVIKKQAKDLGYNMQLLASKKIFFEELFVYELGL